jgi:hypothetical protein
VCWTTGAGGGTATGAAGAGAALVVLVVFLAAEAETEGAGILLLLSEEVAGILERGMTYFSKKKGVKFYLNWTKKSHF